MRCPRLWAPALAWCLSWLLLAAEGRQQWIDGGRQRAIAPADRCHAVPPDVVAAANLTEDEASRLGEVCWDEGLAAEWREAGGVARTPVRDGIPPGVVCENMLWCDKYKDTGICSKVCKPGTVQLEDWMVNAIKTQVELASQLPFCYSQLAGTHNSAITLANGYGNRDLHFQRYLKFIKHMDSEAKIETNDQWFSLTDQLNMGVRLVELDVHYVHHEFRIAHCGGFHNRVLDDLVKLINTVAKLLGDRVFWDSRTMGCQPSMSSIGVNDQRSFEDALREVAQWMNRTDNQNQFVAIFLDSQMDIKKWGKLELLMDTILGVFPRDIVFTPPDLEIFYDRAPWPSPAQMLSIGKRIMFIVDEDWGGNAWKLIFSNRFMCNWSEPSLESLLQSPNCSCIVEDPDKPCHPTMHGQVMRVETCELTYGLLNCGGHPASADSPVLNNSTLPHAYDCGINFPSPDLLTPRRAASTVWSWAPGNPTVQSSTPVGVPLCAYISSTDGRWRSGPCQPDVPRACRKVGHGLRWAWALETANDGGCPVGFVAAAPRHALENDALRRMLRRAGLATARLDIGGPQLAGENSDVLREKAAVAEV